MKKQLATILFSILGIGSVAAASIGGAALYGKYSASARGWKLGSNSSSDFRLGEEYSEEYDYSFADNLGAVNKNIGQYIPPQTKTSFGNNINDFGVVIVNNTQVPVEEFISDFRINHNGLDPLFTIKTDMFSFDNRYLVAVGADDWSKFVKWYAGDQKNPGHLSHGPEAGMISTFQIVPGIEEKGGGAITLGGFAMAKKERGTITFYPDAFFGTFQIFSPYSGSYENRLADHLFGDLEFSIDELQDAMNLINNINKENLELYPGKLEVGPNGENSPNPIFFEASSLQIVNGKEVQKYKIVSDFYIKHNAKPGERLLEIVSKKFPALLTEVDGPYPVKDKDGVFSLKVGPHKQWMAETRIGMPQILASANENFHGFGIDFLKYVAIHEYGHHQTLANAQDFSEGGVQVGEVHSRAPMSESSMFNLDVTNMYLEARSKGLTLENVDPYGEPFADEQQAQIAHSPYVRFKTPDGNLEDPLEIAGEYVFDAASGKWILKDPTDASAFHRYFQPTLDEFKIRYVDAWNTNHPGFETSIYNAFLMNSFDMVSGGINPAIFMGAEDPTKPKAPVYSPTDKGNKLIGLKVSSLLGWVDDKDQTAKNYFGKPRYDANNNLIFGFTPLAIKPPALPEANAAPSIWTPIQLYEALATVGDYPTNWVMNKTGLSKDVEVYAMPAANSPTVHTSLFVALLKYAYPVYIGAGGITDIYNTAKTEQYRQDLLTDVELQPQDYLDQNLVDQKAREFVKKVSPPVSALNPHTFYDTETKGWVTIPHIISTWKDAKKNKILFQSTLTSPDIDLTTFGYNPSTDPNQPYKFDLISPAAISDINGTNFLDYYKKEIMPTLATPPVDEVVAAKTYYVENILVPAIEAIFSISWSVTGPDTQEQYIYQQEGPRPEETKMKFSDYVYNFPEVMTRDFVQISLAQEDSQLSNTNPFLALSQSGTSFEYFVDKSMTSDYDPTNSDSHFSTPDYVRWLIDPNRTGLEIVRDKTNWTESEIDVYHSISDVFIQGSKYSKVFATADEKIWGLLMSFAGIDNVFVDSFLMNNGFFNKTLSLSNGFERDRQQREALGWGLYNNDGTARSILSTDNIKITGPRGETPTTWAQAYWYFLLKMRGIGDRTITGVFRDPDLDKVYVYGYLDVKNLPIENRPHYLAFKNKNTGVIHYEKIYYQNPDELFYLEHQGDEHTNHSLEDEGFVPWTTNRFTAGQYTNEDLSVGTFEVYFADEDKSKSSVRMTLGTRHYVAENGKFYSQAPTVFANINNEVEYRVSTRFNGG